MDGGQWKIHQPRPVGGHQLRGRGAVGMTEDWSQHIYLVIEARIKLHWREQWGAILKTIFNIPFQLND